MVKKRSVLAAMLATILACSASAAFAADRPGTRRATTNPIATRSTVELVASLTAPSSFGDTVLNAIRALRALGRVSAPIRDNDGGYHTEGINDGPDGWDPLGVKSRGLPTDGPAPANSRAQ